MHAHSVREATRTALQYEGSLDQSPTKHTRSSILFTLSIFNPAELWLRLRLRLLTVAAWSHPFHGQIYPRRKGLTILQRFCCASERPADLNASATRT